MTSFFVRWWVRFVCVYLTACLSWKFVVCVLRYIVRSSPQLLRSSILNTRRKRFIFRSAVELSCSLSRLLLGAVRYGLCRFDCYVVGGSSRRSCFDSCRIPVVIEVEGDDDIVDLPIQYRIYISQVCTCSKLARLTQL
jgi:hypothetical protein